eukprot:g10724.t1
MQVLQSVPQLADELEGELTFSLKAYGEHLATIGQPNNALWLYSQAIPLLPRPRGLYTNLGAFQYSLGKAAASIESFQQALALDPGFWPALESLENVKSLAVDRWHFRMLNHSARNEAYSRAIERAVAAAASDRDDPEAGVTVLDIGTGTGILAVMAARAGATHVYACEVNAVLCDIAREVLERNGVADRVTVIHKSSGALKPGIDLPERGVDVVVTELVDSGLLGERIVPVLTDARARGLVAKGGRVIPEGACVYAAVVESKDVRRRSRLLPGNPTGLSTSTVRPTNEEPYTCEDLASLKHQQLTSTAAVLEVDFLETGAALMAPSESSSSAFAGPRFSTTRFPVKRSGRADAVAVWFDLWLDGERGERDVVSTRPERKFEGDASGWDAGIYFTSGACLSEGSELEFRSSAGLDRLHFTLNGEEGIVDEYAFAGGTQSEGASGSLGGASDDRRKLTVDGRNSSSSSSSSGGGPVFLGEMDLARLNDGHFHLSHAHAVAQALAQQGVVVSMPPRVSQGRAFSSTPVRAPSSAQVAPPPPAFVLDLCGAWGVAGLLVAQLEHQAGAGPATRVLAVAESEDAAAVLNAIARENGLGPDRYTATADRLIDLASRGGVVEARPGGGASRDPGGNDTASERALDRGHETYGWPGHGSELGWAVVMASSVVEGSGLLKQGGLGDLELCRQFTSQGGRNVFVPGRLEVVCQGLQRASLFSENRVQSKDCCGVDVHPVNAFSVATFRELNLSGATPCGGESSAKAAAAAVAGPGKKAVGCEDGCTGREPRTCLGATLNANKDEDGGDDEEAFLTAPLACYELDLARLQAGSDGCLERRSANLRVERAGTLHAIAYWYRQSFGTTVVLDTRPEPHDSSSHFRQAAVLLKEPMVVTAGQCLKLCVFCNTSKGFVVQVVGVSESGGKKGGMSTL